MRKYLLLLITFLSANVFAQYQYTTDSRGVGLGGQIGYFNPANADNGNIMLGLLVRAKFTEQVGAEAAINYRSEDYGNGAVTVRSWPITASALFYPINNFYGIVGLGFYNTTFDYPDFIAGVQFEDQTDTQFGFHLGAGLQFPVSPEINIFGDFRYTFLGYEFRQIDQINLDSDTNANFISLMAGVLFMF